MCVCMCACVCTRLPLCVWCGRGIRAGDAKSPRRTAASQSGLDSSQGSKADECREASRQGWEVGMEGSGEDPRGVCVNRVHGSRVNCVFEVCVL